MEFQYFKVTLKENQKKMQQKALKCMIISFIYIKNKVISPIHEKLKIVDKE